MRDLLFICGSAIGAGLAWLVSRRERSRSTVAALIGVACALFGLLASIGGSSAPTTQAGLGFLGAVTPLTWCATSIPTGGGVAVAVRRFSLTLALSLAYGIGCAAVGFALGYGVKYDGHKEFVGKPAPSSIGRS